MAAIYPRNPWQRGGKMKASLDIDTDGLEMDSPLTQEAPLSPIISGQILPGSRHSLWLHEQSWERGCFQPGARSQLSPWHRERGASCSRCEHCQERHFGSRSSRSAPTSLHSKHSSLLCSSPFPAGAGCRRGGEGKLRGSEGKAQPSGTASHPEQ